MFQQWSLIMFKLFKVSKNKLEILVNFNLTSLEYKRIINSKKLICEFAVKKYELYKSLK
jgi:hypothetical protein